MTRRLLASNHSESPNSCDSDPSLCLGRVLGMLAIVGVIVGLLLSSGCSEPTVTSPYSGQPVTAPQLEAESKVYEAEQKAQEQAERAAADAELRRLQREAESELRRLALSQEVEAIEVHDRIAALVEDVVTGREAGRTHRETIMAGMAEKFTAASAELDRQADERLAWLGVGETALQQAGALVPGLGPIVGIGGVLLGGIGAAIQRRRAKEAESETQRVTAGAHNVVDMIDVLKEKSPVVAAAFEENREKIHEWLGTTGVKLVKQLRDADRAAA